MREPSTGSAGQQSISMSVQARKLEVAALSESEPQRAAEVAKVEELVAAAQRQAQDESLPVRTLKQSPLVLTACCQSAWQKPKQMWVVSWD